MRRISAIQRSNSSRLLLANFSVTRGNTGIKIWDPFPCGWQRLAPVKQAKKTNCITGDSRFPSAGTKSVTNTRSKGANYYGIAIPEKKLKALVDQV
jgi:hypothetical protein